MTLIPGTPFPKESRTRACKGVAKFVLTVALCGVPAKEVMDAGAPARFVRLKLAGDATPGTVAGTMYEPATVLAVNVGGAATPVESVKETFDPLNAPDGPLPGGAQVT